MDVMRIETPRAAGKYVRRRREELGMRQSDLARASGITERALSHLELGDSPGVHLDNLMSVAQALGMKVAFIVEDTREQSIDEQIAGLMAMIGDRNGKD